MALSTINLCKQKQTNKIALLGQFSDQPLASLVTHDPSIKIPRSWACFLLSEEGCIYTNWQGRWVCLSWPLAGLQSPLMDSSCTKATGTGWLVVRVGFGCISMEGFPCAQSYSDKLIFTSVLSCRYDHVSMKLAVCFTTASPGIKIEDFLAPKPYHTSLSHKALSAITSVISRVIPFDFILMNTILPTGSGWMCPSQL